MYCCATRCRVCVAASCNRSCKGFQHRWHATRSFGGTVTLKHTVRQTTVAKTAEDDEAAWPEQDWPTISVSYDDSVRDSVLECDTIRHLLNPQPSPFTSHNNLGGGFVNDGDRVALQAIRFASPLSAGAVAAVSGGSCGAGQLLPRTLIEASRDVEHIELPPWCIRAGARDVVYFDPPHTRAAIVTCGGLCPGTNDVIQNLVFHLEQYGVKTIYGIRYGFRGFYDNAARPIQLSSAAVDGIHLRGGTILGTSRGGFDLRRIVAAIDVMGIDMLFVVGGNGGNAAAYRIHTECGRWGLPVAVIGIPKSIDNDILLIDRTFGFDSAVAEAQRALLAAKVEASSARCGIGLVKLMGRQSGFIALQASMASGVADVTLIPEVPFAMHGDSGLLSYVRHLLRSNGHCVICVAEGAGQDMMENKVRECDASGNPVLQDIGAFLKKELKDGIPESDIKYIDPTYMVRAIRACSTDSIYCKVLAHHAVHAAFAGYSGVVVGLINTHYGYLPIDVVIRCTRKVDPCGKMWRRLVASTGQPEFTPPTAPRAFTPKLAAVA